MPENKNQLSEVELSLIASNIVEDNSDRESLELEEILAPISYRLNNDPTAQLSLSGEIDNFMGYLEVDQPHRFEKIKERQQILSSPKIDAGEINCISAIIVAAHQEHKNIYDTLVWDYNQELQPETILHLNVPAGEDSSDEKLAKNLHQTLAEIDRFMSDYPDANVRFSTSVYRGKPRPIGTIRADLTEMIAWDLKLRGRVDDVLIVSGDADTTRKSKNYYSKMIEIFEQQNPDVIMGNLRWQRVKELPYDSAVNSMLRYETFLNNLCSDYASNPHPSDANTAFSLTAYLAVGGYDRGAQLGEMLSVVKQIRQQRLVHGSRASYYAKTVQVRSKESVLTTNSRRLLATMAMGIAPFEAWNPELTEFGVNDKLREEDPKTYVEDAEKNARLCRSLWSIKYGELFTRDVPEPKRGRVLAQARRILDL